MGFPLHDEYSMAISMPKASFKDNDLRNSTYEYNKLLRCPASSSGGFAITYHFINGQHEWAVRCFTSEVTEIKQRYEAIGNFIDSNPSGYFVDVKLIEDGIKVGGKWYPIIKMKWVKGELLNDYIKRNLSNKTNLSHLIYEFQSLLKFLSENGIAHGDLQHGNIIIDNNKIRLVDYDGIYLKELNGLKSVGTGESNYQHPKRDLSAFNDKIDRFSSIVIYLSIYSLMVKPDLWHKYHSADNIIFTKDDFLNPDSSNILNELSHVEVLAPLINKFKILCRMDFLNIPTLEEFLNSNFIDSNAKTRHSTPNQEKEEIKSRNNQPKSKTYRNSTEDRTNIVEALISNKYCTNCRSNKPHITTPEVFCRRGNMGSRIVYTCKSCRRTWYKYN